MRRYPGVRPVAWGVLALCIGAGRLLTGCSGGDNGGGGNGGGGGNCASGKPGASAPHYKVVDLGPLGAQGGVTCSRPAGPQGLTANEIVGGVDLGGACAEEEAVFWVLNTSVSAIAPQPLPGGQSGESDADAISSDGHIVGQVPQSAGLTNAVVLWHDQSTAFNRLNDLPGADESIATALTTNGNLIVGASNIFPSHPVFWQNSTGVNGADVPSGPTQLALPSQFTHGAKVTSVTNQGNITSTQGQIVGWAFDQNAAPSAALFWSSTSATAATLPVPAGTKSSFANSIDDASQIVGGFVAADGSTHAALWPNPQTQPTDLGLLCGFPSSTAVAINAAGQIVGASNTDNNLYISPGHALYWDHTNGLLDLNNLIPANSGWTLMTANAINNAGLIVGAGNFHGTLHGYLLVPTS